MFVIAIRLRRYSKHDCSLLAHVTKGSVGTSDLLLARMIFHPLMVLAGAEVTMAWLGDRNRYTQCPSDETIILNLFAVLRASSGKG
jgi:hypothetical protein